MRQKLRRLLVTLLAVIMILGGSMASVSAERNGRVTIENKGTYYNVVLDLRHGASHRAVGEELGRKILQAVPNYEALLDSVVYEAAYIMAGGDVSLIQYAYQELLRRTNDIKGQVQRDYRDEIEGMASSFTGGSVNVVGDNKLSVDEVYALNVLPDAIRGANCSSLAVYGPRSATGKTLMVKLFDWYSGSVNQLSEIQAVITYKQGSKSICVVGLLGAMTGSNGINDNHVFVGALDAGTGGAYSSTGKRSYCFDARYALENYNTLDAVLAYLGKSAGSYAYSHDFAAVSSKDAKVLENNVNDPQLGGVRTAASALNPGVVWEYGNSIACVNSFVLSGNYPNAQWWIGNSARWDSYRSQLGLKGDKVTFEEMKEIGSYHTGSTPGDKELGDIYNVGTQQIIVLDPSTYRMEVYFKPKGMGPLPATPVFDVININFRNCN